MKNRQLKPTVAPAMMIALLACASFGALVVLPPSPTHDALAAAWIAHHQDGRSTTQRGEPG